MDLLPADVLEDPRYRVPAAPSADVGTAWLRSHVARFVDGPEHARRRALVDRLLEELVLDPRPGAAPTEALAAALGLPGTTADVALVAAAYQPHAPQSAEADDAVERLVAACGGHHDAATAARIGVLVQAHAATEALLAMRRAGREGPPVPTTRRVGPDGVEVAVDLTDAPFGRGPHACPGRDLAIALAEGDRADRPSSTA